MMQFVSSTFIVYLSCEGSAGTSFKMCYINKCGIYSAELSTACTRMKAIDIENVIKLVPVH